MKHTWMRTHIWVRSLTWTHSCTRFMSLTWSHMALMSHFCAWVRTCWLMRAKKPPSTPAWPDITNWCEALIRMSHIYKYIYKSIECDVISLTHMHQVLIRKCGPHESGHSHELHVSASGAVSVPHIKFMWVTWLMRAICMDENLSLTWNFMWVTLTAPETS